jgi:plasmid stabilization system protein ParE
MGPSSSSNTHPLVGRVVPELDIANIREVVRGNYGIMYVLRSRDVLIVAVVHGRQVAGPAGE